MSGAGSQLAPQHTFMELANGRSRLAHLLHALNQPLTGLQCSLELAAAAPRRAEEYVRTLREGLELTGRMRILVEAIRELADLQADLQPADSDAIETFQFDALLRDAVEELLPVAESRDAQLLLVSDAPLPVRGDRQDLAKLIFRFLESALSLTQNGSDLRIILTPEVPSEAASEPASELRSGATPQPAHACLVVIWNQGLRPEHSPFSPQELGLLIAQAGLERAGAEWTCTQRETRRTCTVRLPFAFPQVGDAA
jgi:signal transduction histidine kinase